MAILKHIASRNGRYSDIIEYLTFEHDAKTGKVLKDENGNKIRREDILIDGLLCDPETFDLDCFEANMHFGKNQEPGEVKRHSYIISFDPRDTVDNGLTKEMVQEFGMEFARKYLPGYQTIVCTHSDGNNGSGNLHCHVVINSLRIEDVSREAYMDQKTDPLAGYKHRCTPECERFLKRKVMEMCQERNLYQVDLLTPARRRITDGEYYAELRFACNTLGNAETKTGDHITTFGTTKEQLRSAIETSAIQARSLEEFERLMGDLFHIAVKESRGRYSYIIPGRERGITDRQLGTDYRKDFLEKVIRGEEQFSAKPLPYYKASFHQTEVSRVANLLENEKAKDSPGYAYRIKLSNLQKMARSMNYLSKTNISDLSEIARRIETVTDVLQANQVLLKALEGEMTRLRSLMDSLENYKRLKPVAQAMKDAKHSEEYRKAHEGELLVFQRAKASLKEKYSLKALPSAKRLQEEYDALSEKRNELYEERSMIRKEAKDLENAHYNITQILEKTNQRDKLI